MGEPYIHHTRRVRGVFFEKMELFEFPRDVQDLSVTVMSELSSGELKKLQDLFQFADLFWHYCYLSFLFV